MDEFHKELLIELVKDWTLVALDVYLAELQERARDMDDWIKLVKIIRRKKVRKPIYDTGVRGGT
jgi:hypothetical protein